MSINFKLLRFLAYGITLLNITSLSASEIGYATGKGKNLRTQDSSSSRAICTFDEGDTVEIRWGNEQWSFIKVIKSTNCDGKQGYMHNSIITLNSPGTEEVVDLDDHNEEEDHFHDGPSDLAPLQSPAPILRDAMVEDRLDELREHDFEEKSFRFVVVKETKLQTNPMIKKKNESLCEIKMGARLNFGGSLGNLYNYVQVEDEQSDCHNMKGFVSINSIENENLRYIRGNNVRMRSSSQTIQNENIICQLSNQTPVVFVEKVTEKWTKVYVQDKGNTNCHGKFGFIHTDFLTYRMVKAKEGICGDSRIKNIAVPGWGKQKIGKSWVAKWDTKFCPALRAMAERFGEVKIVSGVRPYKENKIRKGANCSKHRLRWASNGRHVGCGSNRDIGTLGGALDILLPGTWGNGECSNKAALRSQRKAYDFIRRFKDFRVNVYKSGRIHLGLLTHPGASRNPYSTCVR